MQDSFKQPNTKQSVMELIIDQLEELIVTIIEEIRERPGVAAAIVAGLLGAMIGTAIAASVARRRSSAPARVVSKARGMSQAADLAGLGLKLLQNPLVRGYVFAALQSQLKKRIPG